MSAPLEADLEFAVTGRRESFFAGDIARHAEALESAVRGRRILVVGGGGSIGKATTEALLRRRPAAIHVVDLSENYLAELIRDIRSGTSDAGSIELQTHVFDYGSAIMRRFLAAVPCFDLVLNFAAVKHVRSEKDACSLLHMLDVNIVRQARFKRWLSESGHNGRYFTVSTDKAANPVSLMGASKRIMEDVAFDVEPGAFAAVTSARFANVAFSNGSLLQSFLIRLAKRQPLAVPRDTRRYFISHAEAADICLLASLIAPHGHLLVPAFDPSEHLLLLEDVADRVLSICGFAPCFLEDEGEAKRAVATEAPQGRWPVLRTPLDTSGEKPYEEFVGAGEVQVDVGMASLRAVRHHAGRDLDALLAELQRLIDEHEPEVDKQKLAELIARAVPTMRHIETGRSLDQRM